MNKQEIFNKVRDHLLKQNAKSLKKHSIHCAYRSDSGLKCAIGCLITDENYEAAHEGLGAEEVPVVQMVERSLDILIDPETSRLLYDLQDLHDNYNVDEWAYQFDVVADSFGLER